MSRSDASSIASRKKPKDYVALDDLWNDWQPPDPTATDPNVTPTYGVRSYTPATTCDDIHPHGPLPRGTHIYCEAGSHCGLEHLSCLHLTPSEHLQRRNSAMPKQGRLKGGKK
jgi:hypothetical protein